MQSQLLTHVYLTCPLNAQETWKLSMLYEGSRFEKLLYLPKYRIEIWGHLSHVSCLFDFNIIIMRIFVTCIHPYVSYIGIKTRLACKLGVVWWHTWQSSHDIQNSSWLTVMFIKLFVISLVGMVSSSGDFQQAMQVQMRLGHLITHPLCARREALKYRPCHYSIHHTSSYMVERVWWLEKYETKLKVLHKILCKICCDVGKCWYTCCGDFNLIVQAPTLLPPLHNPKFKTFWCVITTIDMIFSVTNSNYLAQY